MPAQQPPGALDGVADVEQLADQCLDPAQGPALVPGEPVRQRAFPQLQLQPGPLPRRQPLPRHRPPGPQRRRAAIPPGLPPPPHRPLRHPQIRGDLRSAVPAGEPPGRIQPQPLPPLLLGGRIPATLRIPHALVIRQRPPGVTTPSRRALRVQRGYDWLRGCQLDEGQLCPRSQVGGRGAPSQKPSQLRVGKRLVPFTAAGVQVSGEVDAGRTSRPSRRWR